MKRYAVPVTDEFIIFELVDKRMGGAAGGRRHHSLMSAINSVTRRSTVRDPHLSRSRTRSSASLPFKFGVQS